MKTAQYNIWTAILAAALAMMCGCQNVQAPPGYIAAGSGLAGRIEFPKEQSPEAGYALLSWYINGQGAAADRWASESLAVSRNTAASLACGLRAAYLDKLQRRYPSVVTVNEEEGTLSFNPFALMSRSDWDAMAVMLEDVRVNVASRHWVEVPLDEALSFLHNDHRGDMVEDFRQWALANPRLELPPLPDREALLEQLRQAAAALLQKRSVVEALAKAELQLASPDSAAAGVRSLQECAAANGDLAAKLSAIGDNDTAAHLEELLALAPMRWVDRSLEEIRDIMASGGDLDALEVRLDGLLRQWSAAEMLSADARVEALCRQAVNELAQRRISDICGRIDALCARHNYYGAADVMGAALNRYGSAESTGCYGFFGDGVETEAILSAVRGQFFRKLPEGFSYYILAQDAALNVDNRFALALAYDECISHIGNAVTKGGDALPEAAMQVVGRSQRNATRARQMAGRLFIPLVIAIDVPAETAWTDVLVRQLSQKLKDSGADGVFKLLPAMALSAASRVVSVRIDGFTCAAADSDTASEKVQRKLPGDGEEITVSIAKAARRAEVSVAVSVRFNDDAVEHTAKGEATRGYVQETIADSVEVPDGFLHGEPPPADAEMLSLALADAFGRGGLYDAIAHDLQTMAPRDMAADAARLARAGRCLDAADKLMNAKILVENFKEPDKAFCAEAMAQVAAWLADDDK